MQPTQRVHQLGESGKFPHGCLGRQPNPRRRTPPGLRARSQTSVWGVAASLLAILPESWPAWYSPAPQVVSFQRLFRLEPPCLSRCHHRLSFLDRLANARDLNVGFCDQEPGLSEGIQLRVIDSRWRHRHGGLDILCRRTPAAKWRRIKVICKPGVVFVRFGSHEQPTAENTGG